MNKSDGIIYKMLYSKDAMVIWLGIPVIRCMFKNTKTSVFYANVFLYFGSSKTGFFTDTDMLCGSKTIPLFN
jgi:hypothetical protein